MSVGYPTTRAGRDARRRPDQLPQDLGAIPHGAKGYRRGCKCPVCRAAERDRHRADRVRANARAADRDRRPWRYQCLIVDPANNECRLALGHDGTHDWARPDETATTILAAYGYAFPGRVA